MEQIKEVFDVFLIKKQNYYGCVTQHSLEYSFDRVWGKYSI